MAGGCPLPRLMSRDRQGVTRRLENGMAAGLLSVCRVVTAHVSHIKFGNRPNSPQPSSES
jgi:hypothetical protein